jgi:hypothetical protein
MYRVYCYFLYSISLLYLFFAKSSGKFYATNHMPDAAIFQDKTLQIATTFLHYTYRHLLFYFDFQIDP